MNTTQEQNERIEKLENIVKVQQAQIERLLEAKDAELVLRLRAEDGRNRLLGIIDDANNIGYGNAVTKQIERIQRERDEALNCTGCGRPFFHVKEFDQTLSVLKATIVWAKETQSPEVESAIRERLEPEVWRLMALKEGK